ncbi:MAG: AbgT family transporter [Bacilli bacterium]
MKKEKIGLIERIGRALPESNILFLILTLVVIIASCLFQGEYTNVGSDTTYQVANLLSFDGFRWILDNIINNFRSYPPLGILIVGVIGFGFSEKVGLLGSLIKKVGSKAPASIILPIIVFLGINSSVASDAGYIVLIPLAGALYAGLGRNPLVGIVAAFASVSAGFGANLLPTPGDGLLGEITKQAVLSMNLPFDYNPMTMNLIFMIASTFFLTIIITFVTKKFIEPRCAHFDYVISSDNTIDFTKVDSAEEKALKRAGLALVILLIVIGLLYLFGPLQSYTMTLDTGVIQVKKPILDNIIVIMIVIFLVPSLAYGISLKKITNTSEYISITVDAMKDMAYIMVFAIFAGNFLQIFNHSQLNTLVANNGASLLIDLNINNEIVLLVLFIFLSAIINLFIGSASAKWTLLAPIFIPMLIKVSNNEIKPDAIQVAYRIADSSTNVITPLMTYMGVVIIFAKKYYKKFEIGNLIAIMMPYSMSIFISWTLFFVVWLILGLPFGI